MKVEDREILFIKKNAPKGFPNLIMEYLDARGVKVNRTTVHTEISTIKSSYNPQVINAARAILKSVKQVEYKQTPAIRPRTSRGISKTT